MTDPSHSNPVARLDSQQRPLEISTLQSADDILQQADALTRHDSHADVLRASQYYLTAAHFLETQDPLRSVQAYYNAGRHLHWMAQFTQAGRAFSNAGRVAERAAAAMPAGPDQRDLQHLAVRAYSRANNSFAEAGELDASEAEYLHERNARLAWSKMQGKRPLALSPWKATSNFGTSIPPWMAWIGGALAAFSLLYELFFRLDWFTPIGNTTPSAWIPLWSGFYYAINVTSSLALVEYQPVHPICQAVVILNVIAGYLLLGIGIGMVGRMMQTR
ncbi:hypothetical protein [Candidatus Nitrospira nitrificans]|uniref:Potassium channel domain-containing protein n=1 Tax=Candidatus Nitrospira nitrificans TaxID=1742973 RepID=A0A0S4L5F2_9BACT|nr:hypothetical protein [Candidatus Nitrospira nitrificans]CUS32915.1 membrane hypothetical protein [Candidatus Nitrospira nitrificans]